MKSETNRMPGFMPSVFGIVNYMMSYEKELLVRPS